MVIKRHKRSQRSSKQGLDKYQVITNRLIELIESGKELPWGKHWSKQSYANLLRPEKAYSGMNVAICSIDTEYFGYSSPYFLGKREANNLGYKIKKGSKSTWLYWFSGYQNSNEDDKSNEQDKAQTKVRFRWLQTFNLDCLDDSEAEVKLAQRIPEVRQNQTPFQDNQRLEVFLSRIGSRVVHKGDRAFYSPAQDLIQMPPKELFTSPDAYYLVRLHEEVHRSGAVSRCDRRDDPQLSSDANYAFEELVAELGASYLGVEFRLEAQKLEHHASYLKYYLEILRGDKKAFFNASRLARVAVDWLLEAGGEVAESTDAIAS